MALRRHVLVFLSILVFPGRTLANASCGDRLAMIAQIKKAMFEAAQSLAYLEPASPVRSADFNFGHSQPGWLDFGEAATLYKQLQADGAPVYWPSFKEMCAYNKGAFLPVFREMKNVRVANLFEVVRRGVSEKPAVKIAKQGEGWMEFRTGIGRMRYSRNMSEADLELVKATYSEGRPREAFELRGYTHSGKMLRSRMLFGEADRIELNTEKMRSLLQDLEAQKTTGDFFLGLEISHTHPFETFEILDEALIAKHKDPKAPFFALHAPVSSPDVNLLVMVQQSNPVYPVTITAITGVRLEDLTRQSLTLFVAKEPTD
jgi:hypothetical protein